MEIMLTSLVLSFNGPLDRQSFLLSSAKLDQQVLCAFTSTPVLLISLRLESQRFDLLSQLLGSRLPHLDFLLLPLAETPSVELLTIVCC